MVYQKSFLNHRLDLHIYFFWYQWKQHLSGFCVNMGVNTLIWISWLLNYNTLMWSRIDRNFPLPLFLSIKLFSSLGFEQMDSTFFRQWTFLEIVLRVRKGRSAKQMIFSDFSMTCFCRKLFRPWTQSGATVPDSVHLRSAFVQFPAF